MKILVVGDFILDHYIFGSSQRLCPEAPVPILTPASERRSEGGAGLVVSQLTELMGERPNHWYGSNSTKTRYFAGSHLLLRVDRDSEDIAEPAGYEGLKTYDAFVVSDYSKGGMTPELASQIIHTGKPVFVDAKLHWRWYRGEQSIAFPNENEAQYIHAPFWAKVVQKLGAKGCQSDGFHCDATVSEVVDVTGAGDIFLAAYVYGATHTNLTAKGCLQFANALAGESCRHVGTFVVGKEFAAEALGKILTSGKSEPQVGWSFRGSSYTEPSQLRPPGRSDIWPEKNLRLSSRIEDCSQASAESIGRLQSLQLAQIGLQSPSVPIESSDIQTPLDQGIVDNLDKK